MSRTTEFCHLPSRPAGARLRRAASWALGWPGRVHRARQLMHALGRLADHELRDVGLTRLDLQAASALPLDADPSAVLCRRAQERRSGERRCGERRPR